MATVTDTDLKELKDLITSGFSRIETEITELNHRVDDLNNKFNVYTAKNDEKLDGIKESIVELRKQSDKQDNRLWVLFSGMFLALMGIIAKFVFNP